MQLFTALRDPVRRGLYSGLSVYPEDWNKVGKPAIPPTWRDELVHRKAKVSNIIAGNAAFMFASYEITFKIANITMYSVLLEGGEPRSAANADLLDSPRIRAESPKVYAVFKPQRASSFSEEYVSGESAIAIALVQSVAIAMFTRYNSDRRHQLWINVVFTAICSLIAPISMKGLRSNIKLLLTFGLWLLLGQIIVSILKGDIVKSVSIGPQDRIWSIDRCEADQPGT